MAIRILYVDLFCGAGGTSTGVERARLQRQKCAKVISCVNHDANAIASHAENHPHALHFTEDIRTLELGPLKAHIERERRRDPGSDRMERSRGRSSRTNRNQPQSGIIKNKMKSKKALIVIEKTLFRNGFPSKRLLGQNGNDVITVYDAITAIELAEQETEEQMYQKAVEAFKFACTDNYGGECWENDDHHIKCGGQCVKMNDFIQKFNRKTNSGIEIIGGWRNGVHYFETVAYAGCSDIEKVISEFLKLYASQTNKDSKIANLAKIGALVAAEIDRLNKN